MTSRTMAALFVCMSIAGGPSTSFADVIQLIRDPGGYFIPNTIVRIENGVSRDLYTDQHGRFILDLPHGTYRATVMIGDRAPTFLLT